MPLFRGREAPATTTQRNLIASAVLVKQSQLRAVPHTRDWQTQAWDLYDRVGELRFAAQWYSNSLSRCRLYVGKVEESGDGDPPPVEVEDPGSGDPRARLPLEDFFGGPAGGQSEALARIATHLVVPGETYVVGMDMPDGNRRWMVASSDEFKKIGQKVTVRDPDTDEMLPVELDQSTVIRMWRPHARRAWEADSPVRALLSTLKEISDLSAHITASVESRLAGAGLLLLPDSATLPTPMGQDAGKPIHEDPAMATLIDAMVTPISDRDSAAAVVPIIVRVPESAIGAIKHLTFATPLDSAVQTLREAAIRRLATGLDMPPEVVLGLSNSNHWTAWQLEEAALKQHISPLLGLICEALTEKYLRPALVALGVPNPEHYQVWFDASSLALRPNRSPDAQALHQQMLVKDSAVRREAGFTDDDAPDPQELKTQLLIKLSLANVDPLNVAPYLKALGIELDLGLMAGAKPPAVPTVGEPAAPGGGEAGPGGGGVGTPAPTPAPPGPPTTPGAPDNPATAPSGQPGLPAAAALTAAAAAAMDRWSLAAVEMGVLRALEMSGKRMLNWGGRAWRGRIHCDAWDIHTQIPASDHDLDKLLEGAYSGLELVLDDQPCIQKAVDGYVRGLLLEQRHHSRDELRAVLRQAGCVPGGESVAA